MLQVCPDDNQLMLYLSHSLPDALHSQIETHIAECECCTEVLVHLVHILAPDLMEKKNSPVGHNVAHYEVVKRLGKGGMGEVYEAYDTQLHRRVALKMVSRDLSHEQKLIQLNQRLVREARTLAALTHPNILPVYEIGEWDGQVFMAMQLVEGVDVRTWQMQERPTLSVVVKVYIQAAKALDAAHDVNIIHRDIKPDNLLLAKNEHVYLADFGLVANDASYRLSAQRPKELFRLTRTGALLGTPGYIAPELYKGHIANPLTDQFAFCVSLYESLFGQKPHVTQPYPEHLRAIATGDILYQDASSLSAALMVPLAQGLHPQPTQRYASMKELADALHACLQQHEFAATQPDRPVALPFQTPHQALPTSPPTRTSTLIWTLLGGVLLGLLVLWGALQMWSVPLGGKEPPKRSSNSVGVVSAKHTAAPRATRKRQPMSLRLARRVKRRRTPSRVRRRFVLAKRKSPRPKRRLSKAVSHCGQLRLNYTRLKKGGWQAFESPSGRKLWLEHARCLAKRGACDKALSLYKQYASLLASRLNNGEMFAYNNLLRYCPLRPFLVQIRQRLSRVMLRFTAYYSVGQRFCLQMTQGLLKRRGHQAMGLGRAQKNHWMQFGQSGLRCLAKGLRRTRVSLAKRRSVCNTIRRLNDAFRRKIGKATLSALAFEDAYPRCHAELLHPQ